MQCVKRAIMKRAIYAKLLILLLFLLGAGNICQTVTMLLCTKNVQQWSRGEQSYMVRIPHTSNSENKKYTATPVYLYSSNTGQQLNSFNI